MAPDHMDLVRLRRIEDVVRTALARGPDERAAFLAVACADDPALRAEVDLRIGQALSGGDGRAVSLSSPDPAETLTGQELGPYRIGARLGVGGMGEVYRATDTRLNRQVAVKVLRRSLDGAAARDRFRREVRAVSGLNHPHIVTVHEAAESGGRDYLVTELVDGGTLATWARAEHRTWRQAIELLVGVADGVAAAHEAGILHRDIKPDNILVARNGYAKLADFGLAKIIGSADGVTHTAAVFSTQQGVVLGTIDYMSPEQARGMTLDSRSDIFSFGVVLYELLAARRPFTGETDLHVIEAVLHETPAPLGPDLPQPLRGIVEKALEKEPADRYQTMRDLVVDLRRLTRHTTELPSSVQPRARMRRWMAAAAVLLAAGAAAAVWGTTNVEPFTTGPPPIRTIAVLPLENLSADQNEEFFSDGMTEQLISSLAQVRALKVISRTSMMRYKGTDKTMPEIGRELGVDGIIEGTVRRVGGRVRVSAQLIHAASDGHVWARDFDHDFTDILMLQAEIANAIVREIRVQVTPDEARRLSAAQPVSPEAYELFMLGRYHLWQGNPASWKQAIDELEGSIRLQPDYAPAHASLAMTWSMGLSLAYTQSEGSMRSAAQRAIELDPELAEGYAAKGDQKFTDWDWQGTIDAYERAMALDPVSVDVCGCYGNVLAAFGRFDDAIRIVERGVSVNPLAPDLRFNYGFVLYMARRYADAERQLLRATELEPRLVGAATFLSRLYLRSGRFDEALATADRPELQASSALGVVYAHLGRRDDALNVLSRMNRERDPLGVGMIYVALGETDRGFEWLSKAVDQRQGFARWLKVSPDWDAVRSDPRFDALVARLKLPTPP
jgi:serine/threonine-protein kinase